MYNSITEIRSLEDFIEIQRLGKDSETLDKIKAVMKRDGYWDNAITSSRAPSIYREINDKVVIAFDDLTIKDFEEIELEIARFEISLRSIKMILHMNEMEK